MSLGIPELDERYPNLAAYTDPVKPSAREIVGRELEVQTLMAGMLRPELPNILLLAAPGVGKTSLVQTAMARDTNRRYLEVDLARMIAGLHNREEMASKLKSLFDEAEAYVVDEKVELVIFMDEVHQVVQLSPSAVEALKPVLAASGTRGIRVIAATTNEEFHEHIAPNQPLVERLQRIDVPEPDSETVVAILQGMAERYGVADQFHDDRVFRLIVDLTNRYNSSGSQPRKSILLLDGMVGWHRLTNRRMDKDLVADVLKNSTGINIALRVDASKIQEKLDQRVFSQKAATRVVADRLQLVVADLNDKSRPASSFLFSGSTGVGKDLADSTRVPVATQDGSVAWKLHGDLVPGDRVFQRDGVAQEVLGIFPQGVKDVYRLTFWDGRTVDAGEGHLWPVYTSKMRSNLRAGKTVAPKIMTTMEMIDKGVVRSYGDDSRKDLKFFVPASGAVQWPEQDLALDPYAMGVFIGNGCLTLPYLTLSSDDAYTVLRVGEALGSIPKPSSSYSWVFPTGEKWGRSDKLIQTRDVFEESPDLIGAYSGERRIPAQYLSASIDQRWELVRGLFDTDGTIDATSGRFNVSYSTFSKGLADDVRELLFSLGVSNTINAYSRTRDDGCEIVEHRVHAKVGNEGKEQFFALPRKRKIAEAAVAATAGRGRVKRFDMVGITSIEKLPEQESTSCIYVSGEEHLYQAGQFIVTHNTELTKQLAQLMFGDASKHTIRFDMSEFALETSLETFRTQLTRAVWNSGNSVIMLDEVEKAHEVVTRLLLQVLDDGRLSDERGRQVSFLNSYIVLTTNAGAEIFRTIAQYEPDDDGSGEKLDDYLKNIRESIVTTKGARFPPELLGRIDVIVPFQPLTLETQRKIVLTKLGALVQEVRTRHNVRMQVDGRVLTYLVDDNVDIDSNAGGARASVAKMSEKVTTAVATFINEHPQETAIRVDVDGTLVTEDKAIRKGTARIVVSAVR